MKTYWSLSNRDASNEVKNNEDRIDKSGFHSLGLSKYNKFWIKIKIFTNNTFLINNPL